MATELLSWSKPFHTVHHGGLEHGDTAWFLDGQLNASYNCVDRHALANPDKVQTPAFFCYSSRNTILSASLSFVAVTAKCEWVCRMKKMTH